MADIILPGSKAYGEASRDVGTPAYDPKKHDPYFDGLSDQLADKGFITAASDDLITWARTGSLMWMTFGLVNSIDIAFDEMTVHARRAEIVKVISFLRDDPLCRFASLIDIAGADYPGRDRRFDVVYHMLSMSHNV